MTRKARVTLPGVTENKYAAPHVWNLVAKILRETYATGFDDPFIRGSRRTIETLAVKFAQRFQEDEGFDPLAFLDKCSPNPDLYPLSELWEPSNDDWRMS